MSSESKTERESDWRENFILPTQHDWKDDEGTACWPHCSHCEVQRHLGLFRKIINAMAETHNTPHDDDIEEKYGISWAQLHEVRQEVAEFWGES